jgi:pantothenate kinase
MVLRIIAGYGTDMLINDHITKIVSIALFHFESEMDNIIIRCRVNFGFSSFSAVFLRDSVEVNLKTDILEKREIADCLDRIGEILDCKTENDARNIEIIVNPDGKFKFYVEYDDNIEQLGD